MAADNNAMAQSINSTGAPEGEEIDRIMKEIEDLEKKMDAPQEAEAASVESTSALATEPAASVVDAEPAAEASTETVEEESAKVVPIRPTISNSVEPVGESMAESDAVPVSDEPLMRASESSASGGLSLKIGGCASVSLEFEREGMTVTLRCDDDGLAISTDQGAEFRLPFKRSA